MTKAEHGDRYPVDCSGSCFISPASSSSSSQKLQAGYQVVALRVEAQFAEKSKAVLDDLCLNNGAIYIKAADGSKTDCFGVSFTSKDKGKSLLFTPQASAKGFTLYVKGNPSIDLGI